MPSRRRVLSGLGLGISMGIAGCSILGTSGSDAGGEETRDCQGSALEHGDGDVLDRGVFQTLEDGDVRLEVPLSVETIRNQDLRRVVVYNRDGSIEHVIPVSAGDEDVLSRKARSGNGVISYEQYLGRRPFHAQYRVEVEDAAGTTRDSITIEFNCFADVEEQSG